MISIMLLGYPADLCMALRCSPNLSGKAPFVCPMHSAGVFDVFLH